MNNNKQQTKGNKMKKIAMVIGVLTVLATSANAFTWTSPNIYGVIIITAMGQWAGALLTFMVVIITMAVYSINIEIKLHKTPRSPSGAFFLNKISVQTSPLYEH